MIHTTEFYTDDRIPTECHCGRPLYYGYDGDPTHTRDMCADCEFGRPFWFVILRDTKRLEIERSL